MDKSNYFTSIQNNQIFSNSWLFIIPLDLSSCSYIHNNCDENENNLNENNINNFVKFLPKNLINMLFVDDSNFQKKESSSNNVNNNIVNNNFGFKQQILSQKKERKTNEFVSNNNLKSVNNYNINIYNPNINFVNIYYSPYINKLNNPINFSKFGNVAYPNLKLKEKLESNEKNSNYMNSNQSVNKSIYINNRNSSFNNNYVNNIEIQASNNNIIIKNKDYTEQKEVRKQKTKKKKKPTDEYTIEVFGRLGWICEYCINFNYKSRKKCNRCKKPKVAIKKEKLLDENGINIINTLINGNHKEDWNCSYCRNINYSFRTICNRCQNPKEKENNKFELSN